MVWNCWSVRSVYTDGIDGTRKIVENERSKITTLVLNVKETGTAWLNWTLNFPTKPILQPESNISGYFWISSILTSYVFSR